MITADYTSIYEAISSIVKENNNLPDRYGAAGYYNQRLIEEVVDATLLLKSPEVEAEPEHEDVLDSIDVAKELVYGLERLHERLLEKERRGK
jgi:ribosome-associated translation inhibitor RaiA